MTITALTLMSLYFKLTFVYSFDCALWKALAVATRLSWLRPEEWLHLSTLVNGRRVLARLTRASASRRSRTQSFLRDTLSSEEIGHVMQCKEKDMIGLADLVWGAALCQVA
jgi:hypothetical protein